MQITNYGEIGSSLWWSIFLLWSPLNHCCLQLVYRVFWVHLAGYLSSICYMEFSCCSEPLSPSPSKLMQGLRPRQEARLAGFRKSLFELRQGSLGDTWICTEHHWTTFWMPFSVESSRFLHFDHEFNQRCGHTLRSRCVHCSNVNWNKEPHNTSQHVTTP